MIFGRCLRHRLFSLSFVVLSFGKTIHGLSPIVQGQRPFVGAGSHWCKRSQCYAVSFYWTEISGESQWAGKPAPNTTQEMGGQS